MNELKELARDFNDGSISGDEFLYLAAEILASRSDDEQLAVLLANRLLITE
jgi:hypothetical protein